MGERFWLSDAQWTAIEPLLPHLGGKPRVDDRRVISGILHRYQRGLRWRTIPAEYGPRTTLFVTVRRNRSPLNTNDDRSISNLCTNALTGRLRCFMSSRMISCILNERRK